ncbi:MAG: hypothetical protein GF317_23130 [Candidatus Lokiarchaeota archaeon]|nr:hypothetical protein [Candidatus Lokiarchaeota archaeon]
MVTKERNSLGFSSQRNIQLLQIISMIIITIIVSLISYFFGLTKYPFPVYLSYWYFSGTFVFFMFTHNKYLNTFLVTGFLILIVAFYLFILGGILVIREMVHLAPVFIIGFIIYKRYLISIKLFKILTVVTFLWFWIMTYADDYTVIIDNDLISFIMTIICWGLNFILIYLHYKTDRKEKSKSLNI